MTVFYFSATGNSLAVAKRIGGTLISIPQVADTAGLNYSDDVIGLIVPVYAFTTPCIVKRFLKKVRWQADYVFAIGTHGDRYGGFCTDLAKFCQKRKLRLDYAATLKMVDNALIGYEIAEQIRTLPSKRVDEQFTAIAADIAARKRFIKPMLQSEKRRNRQIKMLRPLIMNPRIGRKMIRADAKCTRCGVCAAVCPNGNIAVTETVKIGKRCEMCGGCVHNCPANALHQRGEKSAARWRNPEVSLKELIEANNREERR
ncbi:MAG: EFR1 family ferrodoxin [Clostridiales bacterium]|jgi:ferredoxin|nr:EFR1 family ferrodoxin [Clostridiales bacterium]